MQDSLPAAGPALPGGIGYPQGSCERFHGCNDSPFPSFLARCQSPRTRGGSHCLTGEFLLSLLHGNQAGMATAYRPS